MKIIVGLGNPGQKFQKTRHNIGFRIIEEFGKKNNFSDFYLSKKFNAEISKGRIFDQKIILAKPQTFMNNSGQTVKLLISKFYQLKKPSQINSILLAIHDDIDLPLGKIKIVKNRGAAGHKGVESIIKELGTKNFVRFRIGINRFAQYEQVPRKREQKSNLKNQKLDEFVLKKFSKEEEKIVKEVIQEAGEAIETVLEKGIEKAMNRYNSLNISA